jgi:DUF4097 and DUF4098 domain-containing protein YvlB
MRRAIAHRLPLAAILILGFAGTAAAQSNSSTRFIDNCRRNNRGDYEQFCETRDFSLAAVRSLIVDGRENGGITVHAWDKSEIQVVGMVQAHSESQNEAQSIARQIVISSANGTIRADGPRTTGRRNESWSVSFEIWAPRQTELALTANNGGISVDGMNSRMTLETTNGGLTVTDVDGDVRGSTVNGGITAELSGDRWRGSGLDLRTSNGGVHLYVPSNYSALLETGTVNGGMDVGFPMTVQGTFGRTFTTQLGSGGAKIRAVTTNGGVSIRRR